MSKTKWDPYSGAPAPPPPPPRSLVNRNTKPPAPLLPPPSRTSSTASRSLSSSSSAPSTPPLPPRGPSSVESGPPPPLPRRTPPSVHSPSQPNISIGPPPIVRSTRPNFPSHPVISKPLGTLSETEIDWSNLSPEDKHIFFSWLDEFFANFTPPRMVSDAAVAHCAPITSHAPPQSSVSIHSGYIYKSHTS